MRLKTSLITNVILLSIIMVMSFFLGCSSTFFLRFPDKEDYNIDEEYRSDVCLYYSAKAGVAFDCSKREDAAQKVRRHITCKDPAKREQKQSYQNCLDKLD